LRSPEKSGFLITSIDGLGPSKADISMSELSGVDGSLFNSSRANTRNIVFQLSFLELPDIETVRRMSYKYFPLKENIRIEIETDGRTAYTYGYVESNEPNIFSDKEGCTISVVCPSSYLLDPVPEVTPFSYVTPLFEFPFSNESTTLKLIEISTLSIDTEKTVVYGGETRAGMILHVHAKGAASGLTFINSRTLERLSIDSELLFDMTGADISLGDDIYISTTRGNKYAILRRGGEDINILNALEINPVWFQLNKGDNTFAYTADSGLSNLSFEITAEVLYQGI